MACVDIVKDPREEDITRLATDSYISEERERGGGPYHRHGPQRLEALAQCPANTVWSK